MNQVEQPLINNDSRDDSREEPNAIEQQTYERADEEQMSIQAAKYRWVILGCLFCNIMASCMFMNSLSTIVMEVSEALDKEPTVINLLTLVFIFLFIPMSIVSAKINRMVYPDTVLRICSIITILMCGLRLTFTLFDRFFCLLIPSIVAALCQAPVFSCIAQVPAIWFPKNQQGIATGLCGLAIAFGGIVAFILPALYVNGDQESILPQLHELIKVQSIIMTALSMVSLVFMREKPHMSPSIYSKSLTDKIEQFKSGEGMQQVKMPFKCTRNYSLIVVFFVGLYSLQLILSVIVGQLLRPYYTAVEVSTIAVCFIAFGIVGNIIFGLLLDKMHNPIPLARVQALGSFLSSLYLWCIIKTGKGFWMAIGTALLGFFVLPTLPVGFQLAIRIEKPEIPSAYTGIMMMCMYLWALSASTTLSFIADTWQQTTLAFFALTTFTSLVITFFIKPDFSKEEDEDAFISAQTHNKVTKEADL